MKFWTGKRMAGLAIAAAIVSAGAGSANADAILSWNSTSGFAGTEMSIDVAAYGPGIVASGGSITRSGLGTSAGGSSINSTGFPAGFLTFSLTTTDAGSYSLTEFQIQDRASNTGPRDLGLFYSGDNFTSPIASLERCLWALAHPRQESPAISGITLQPSTTYTFEIKATDGTSNNGGSTSGAGTYRVISPALELDGTPVAVVVATPEPASLGLLGAGAVALISRRSRKSQNVSK